MGQLSNHHEDNRSNVPHLWSIPAPNVCSMSELRFQVPGMTCGHCVSAVKTEVSGVPGVSSVDVDLDTKAVVVHGSQIDVKAIIAAVDEAGYEAVGIA